MVWQQLEKHLGWQARLWSQPTTPEAVNQDEHLLLCLPGQLRLAVMDGVTPSPETARPCGQDGAVWASGLARAALRSTSPLERCVQEANALLWRPDLASSHNTQTTCIAADLSEAGRLQLLRAGDCEAWVCAGGEWQSLFLSPMLADQALRAWTRWGEEHASATKADRQQAQLDLLDHPSSWNTSPLGLFAELKLQYAELEVQGASDLVLASDGARLDADRLADLDAWLAGLRAWESEHVAGNAAEKRHDDVTVLHLSRV